MNFYNRETLFYSGISSNSFLFDSRTTTTVGRLKMNFITRILKIIWLSICIAGNIYQVEQICNHYLQYLIVTATSVKFPTEFNVPIMSYCAYETEIVDWDKLEVMKPDIKEKLNMSTLSKEEIIRKMSSMKFFLKLQFQGIIFQELDLKTRASLVHQFHDLFDSCSIIEKDGTTIKGGNCSDLFEIQTFHFTFYVCHAFNIKTEELMINYLDNNRAEIIPGFLYLFRLTEKAINVSSQATIMFNENNEYHRLGFFHSLLISKLNNLISLQYEEYANALLEAPYVTNCLKYKKANLKMDGEEITDRGSCYETCLKNKSRKLLGPDTSFPGVFMFEKGIKKRSGHKLMTAYELFRNKSLLDIRNNVSHECDEVCASPKCEETFFVPILRSSIKYPSPLIITYTMQSPKIDTSCEPKLSFIVFVTNAFSTLGFWIGLSLFSIVNIFTNLITASMKLLKKRKLQSEYNHSQNIIKNYLRLQQIYNNRWRDSTLVYHRRRRHYPSPRLIL